MSGSKHRNPFEGREWLEELKTNRRTQGGLAAFGLALAFMVFMLWPEAPKRRPTVALTAIAHAGNDSSLQSLEKLPDLAKLGQAGELPSEDRMFRDLFLFDGPPPPPLPPPPPPPPPTPPTEEQLRALAAQQEKDAEFATRPQGFRYLGFLERKSVGRIGAFMKGEEPVSIKLGDTTGAKWRLITVTESHVEFQNLKYPELRHRINAADAAGGPRGAGATNEF
jgi:hypothetical protein